MGTIDILIILLISVSVGFYAYWLLQREQKKIEGLWWYKDKCRECGKVETWSGGDVRNIPYSQFEFMVTDKIRYPRGYECEKCRKTSVHDIVSYSPNQPS